MKLLLKYPHYVLIFLGILISLTAKADVWGNPKIETYYSENKEYKLVITPKFFPEKYSLWNYYKSNKHPQTKRILRKKKEFMANITGQDTILTPCTAEMYHINETDSSLIWKKPLLNFICPVCAIVANNGSSIATFDNWYSMGYGENVFVIYDKNGGAKKTYKLDEISPFPLNDYMMTISSLHWNKEVKYIDNDRIEIIFSTRDDRDIKRIYNIKKLEFEK